MTIRVQEAPTRYPSTAMSRRFSLFNQTHNFERANLEYACVDPAQRIKPSFCHFTAPTRVTS
ncbi:hypothetical protein E1A91_A08G061800v1 [Gossypium mustelinum]|uniref:Uncharacterized protein n=1 Tax=Gossypium mustelinum TaxID=34275 RepID=A0A5D2Y5T6_GOSMU|nr:hypothetical protein E1A91_A08G061800v1 [Gossypium mustelinum]